MESVGTVKLTQSDKIFTVFVYILLAIAFVIVAYPLLYMLSASFSDPVAVNSGEMLLFPQDITFDGYRIIFENNDLWRGFRNTIIITALGTLTNLFVTIPTGYVLSRPEFAARDFFTKFMMVTMFVGGGLIPEYLLVTGLGLGNSFWALILPKAASVYNIIVTRTFFENSIPNEIVEAATVDGASTFKTFTAIILPLSKPIIAVMALFYGVGHWNAYFDALIYINDRGLYPLQMILREILVLQDLAASPTGQMTGELAELLYNQQQLGQVVKYGVMIVSSLPLILIYPFLQKYFVKGVMVGSVKG